jgi:pyruvate formate lyase activating enzyme
MVKLKHMKEAILYQKQPRNIVNCLACNHFCSIGENKLGICGVRKNIKGALYSLNYGKIIAEHVDPIEKKPLFNFLPGSLAYSIATVGCNFKCLHCQNADISQVQPSTEIPGADTYPAQIVDRAKENHCQSIAYTYTEPTIFVEFALETMKLARDNGLKNVWVSNGYFSEQTLNLIKPHLDAINIDLKFFSKENYLKICGAKLQPVIDNLKLLVKNKIHTEITTLIIPGFNDSLNELENIANFIKNELNADVPWHVSAFHPSYKLLDVPPTTKAAISLAHEIGKKAGLNYVYAGNVVSENLDNTYCPNCAELLIDRTGYIIENKLKKPVCPTCKTKIIITL